MIKAILFDLDGVLVDACDWHFDSLNMALKDVVGYEISREDHEIKYNGLPTKVKLKMLGVSDGDFDKIWNLKQRYTLNIIHDTAQIMQEKIELHSWLKSNNIKIGCVTNSIRVTAEEMLRKTGQYDFMDVLIANEDVKNNKPYPDCYNKAVDLLDLPPSSIIIVEDSDKGISAAISSKITRLMIVKNTLDVTLENVKKFIEDEA
jgi:HAD superfamily hydrolase (TIGR01509 family)